MTIKKATWGTPWLPYDTDKAYMALRALDQNRQCRLLIEQRYPGDQETVSLLLAMLDIPEEDEPSAEIDS